MREQIETIEITGVRPLFFQGAFHMQGISRGNTDFQ